MRSASFRLRSMIPPLAVCVLLAAGCFFGPTGTNVYGSSLDNSSADNTASGTPSLYPTPDANHVVTVTYMEPAGRNDTEAQFQFTPPNGGSPTAHIDDSTSGEFMATFDATPLTPGLYTVDVFLGSDSAPSGRVPFLVPGSSASGTSNASGTASGS